jgi:Zn finger protein HypA/HybF involved in hydrogenase expression
MHEMSIALDVCRIAEERVGTDQVANVVTVGLDVGTDSGVEVENLRFCLDALLTQPPFAQGQSVIACPVGDDLRVTYIEVDDGNPDD